MCSNQPRAVASNPVRRLTRAFAQSSPAGPAANLPAGKATFEYAGETALTVVSPVTKRIYRFERPGARLEVDLRDRSWLAFVPDLAMVRS